MNKKYLIISIIVLLILLFSTCIPHMHTIESVDVFHMSDYPALYEAYQKLCEERALYDIKTENAIQIVTVRNLWGRWERYILPCFAANTPDIPRAGNADFTAFMHILSPWNRESLFTKLCPLRLDTFGISMVPGENAMVYQLAEVLPMGVNVNSAEFGLRMKQNCDREPGVYVYYTMATLNSAHQPDQLVTSEFTWSYRLRICGYEFEKSTFVLSNEHTVNA